MKCLNGSEVLQHIASESHLYGRIPSVCKAENTGMPQAHKPGVSRRITISFSGVHEGDD